MSTISPSYEEDKKVDLDHVENQVHHLTPHTEHHGDDDALKVLADGGDIQYSVEEDRKVLRKIDLWVLTPMMIIYTLQQMDKSSTSYAAVFGLQAETGLHGTQYSWLGSIVYVAQLFCQPLSSYALVKFSVRWWIVGNLFMWGATTACIGAAHNFTGLIVARFFLGCFEATVAPTFITITQMWWRRREQSFRTVAWQISNSLASIFGPLLAYGVGHIDVGIKPYQSIFIFLGCLTVALTPLVAFMLPHSPSTAKFLRHGNDRYIAIERLRSNNTGTRSYTWRWDQFWEAVRDPKSYGWFLCFLLVATPSGGFASFGGLITKGFGFDSFHSILFQMPIGVMQIIVLLTFITTINKFRLRFPFIAFLCLFPIGGAIGMFFIPRKNTHGLLGAYYVASLFGCIQPLLYSWATLNAAGHTKKVCVTGILFVAQCAGNIIGPQVYLAKEAPLYHTGLAVDIACWGALCVVVLCMGTYLKYLNKQKEKKRVAAGLPANIQDMSIMTLEDAAAYKEELKQTMIAQGMNVELLNEDAFEDQTDFDSLWFQYVC